MLVRFWGTRGSLPVAAKAGAIRAKIARALVAANGQSIASIDQAEAFIDRELDFAASATYGGATACVEIESGDSYFICDMTFNPFRIRNAELACSFRWDRF